MGTFQQVATDWTTLSDNDKISLFATLDELTLPTMSELQTLNKFKIATWSDDGATTSGLMTATPKLQLIIPKELISITIFEDINSITPVQTITKSQESSLSAIGYVFTNDLINYKIYNTTSGLWETVDITAITPSTMTLEEVSAITKAQWHSLIYESTSTGLGIGFTMLQTYVDDVVNIDSLSLNIDSKGTWNHAIYGTEVTYGYTSNNVLAVTLVSDGSYKINYNELAKQ